RLRSLFPLESTSHSSILGYFASISIFLSSISLEICPISHASAENNSTSMDLPRFVPKSRSSYVHRSRPMLPRNPENEGS
ncbi:hypothetical protein LINGRAHAP2_LOCUS20738, partial [Linum grandiflorum]